jgi:hypothetical protein
VRRHVDHEDRAARVAHLAGQRLEPGLERLLRLLARGVPRSDVRPPRRQELEVARQVEHLPVGVRGEGPLAVQDRVDREVVVVSGDDVERNRPVGEPLVGQVEPLPDPLVHQLVQERVAGLRIAHKPVRLLGGRDERVEADVGDVALERRELVVARGPAAHAEELGLVGRAVLDDRDDRLPREVAGHQRDVRLVDVELDRIQELPPRLLGSVEVARQVDAHLSRVGSR